MSKFFSECICLLRQRENGMYYAAFKIYINFFCVVIGYMIFAFIALHCILCLNFPILEKDVHGCRVRKKCIPK